MNRTQNKDLRFDYSVRFSASDFPAAIISEMETVLFALRAAGYDPVDQLYGYMLYGDDRYITRLNGARDIIRKMDQETIKAYLEQYRKIN